MKFLALFFALSLYVLASPTHSTTSHNLIRLPTADKNKAVASASGQLLDSDGDEIRPGVAYNLHSTSWGALGREVKLGSLDSTSKCPSDVLAIHSLGVVNTGDPVKFTPADPNAAVISPSTFVSITFDVASNRLCQNKLTWQIMYDRTSAEYLLRAGEFCSNLSDQFKIEVYSESAAGTAYKITYCPFGSDDCYNVGRFYDESLSAERFALSKSAFGFWFKKANAV